MVLRFAVSRAQSPVGRAGELVPSGQPKVETIPAPRWENRWIERIGIRTRAVQ